MWLARLRIAVMVILGIALVAWVELNLRQFRELTVYRLEREAELKALRNLRETLRQRDLQKAPVVEEGPLPQGDLRAAVAQRDATIAQLSHALGEARTNLTELQTQLSQASDEHEKALASLQERHQKEKEDLQASLKALQKESDSTQANLQASSQQIADLEAANAKLKSDHGQGAARAAESVRILADLRDLDRRRDTYLTSIIRRYRDITGEFRAMSGMLESGRDPNTGAFSSAGLTRIQNAIALADDDLRQLGELNARARQLEKKLEKK